MNAYPGWKMSVDQHRAYWKLLSQVNRALALKTTEERERTRKLIHERAFGRPDVSAKEINHLEMFDAFKAECLVIAQPSNVTAQVAQVNQPLTRLKHAIRALAPDPYWQKISESRFHTRDLDDLNPWQLEQLRNTLTVRSRKPTFRFSRVPGPRVSPRAETPELATATDNADPF